VGLSGVWVLLKPLLDGTAQRGMSGKENLQKLILKVLRLFWASLEYLGESGKFALRSGLNQIITRLMCTFNKKFFPSFSVCLSSQEFQKVRILNKSCSRFKEVSERLNPQATNLFFISTMRYLLVRDILKKKKKNKCIFIAAL
jgi:hypothetical protein